MSLLPSYVHNGNLTKLCALHLDSSQKRGAYGTRDDGVYGRGSLANKVRKCIVAYPVQELLAFVTFASQADSRDGKSVVQLLEGQFNKRTNNDLVLFRFSSTLFIKQPPRKPCRYPSVNAKEPWLRHTWDYGDLEAHSGGNPCVDPNFICYITNWVHYNVHGMSLLDFFFRPPPYTLAKISMPQASSSQQHIHTSSFVPPSEH